MIPILTLTHNEIVDHEDGYVTMRLHVTLPNGAHYFIDEDNWHVGVGDDAVTFARQMNEQLTKADADVIVAQIVGDDAGKIVSHAYGHQLFTIIDRAELRPMDIDPELAKDWSERGVPGAGVVYNIDQELSESDQYALEQMIDGGIDEDQAAVNAEMYLNRPSRSQM